MEKFDDQSKITVDKIKEKVYEKLTELEIQYSVVDHEEAHTIEAIEEQGILKHGYVCKNLFLRDASGKRHFLVVLDKDKQANMKELQQQIGCSRLSFGSDERLMKQLGLLKGSVTPLSVINNLAADVEVIIDKSLECIGELGFHPNHNTSTVWISYSDLLKYIRQNGNPIKFVEIE